MNYKDDEAFMAVWAEMEANGYQYGDDALQNVYFGWKIRQPEIDELKVHIEHVQDNYDADMETAIEQLHNISCSLMKHRREKHTLMKQLSVSENMLRRAFVVYTNLDLDIANVE